MKADKKKSKKKVVKSSSPLKRFEDENFVDTSKPVWNYSLLTDEDV